MSIIPVYVLPTEEGLWLRAVSIHEDSLPIETGIPTIPTVSRFLIGVHDGVFHADEVLACAVFACLPFHHVSGNSIHIIRTRNEDILNLCDVVCDVGKVYDPRRGKFDHHLPGFTMPYPGSHIPMSSAGMVWFHYGREAVRYFVDSVGSKFKRLSEDSDALVQQYVYDHLFQEVDAEDNGIGMCWGGRQQYCVHTTFSKQLKRFNPSWNEESDARLRCTQFQRALHFAMKHLQDTIRLAMTDWLPARQLVFDAAVRSEDSRVVVLDKACPWVAHIIAWESVCSCRGQFLFVVYPVTNVEVECWHIRAISDGSDPRVMLPVQWCGLIGNIAQDVTRLDGIIFIHKNGHLAGATTKENAVRLATMAIELWQSAIIE